MKAASLKETMKYFSGMCHLTLIIMFALGLTSTASAHHSASQYDFSQMAPVTGKVIHVDIANPHIDLILELDNEDGTTREVQFEGHARNNVYRRGWRPGAFAEGDVITIHIAPMRDGTDGGYIQQFTMADGSTF